MLLKLISYFSLKLCTFRAFYASLFCFGAYACDKTVCLTFLIKILLYTFKYSIFSVFQFSENAVDPGVDLSLLFSCLFAIFSSSMGIFLLYQHVVSRTDASQHWKRFLQCKKQLYDVNHENVQLTANVKSKQPKNTGTASGKNVIFNLF